jgi:hypothetical protein
MIQPPKVTAGTAIPLIGVSIREPFRIGDVFEIRNVMDAEKNRWENDQFISELVPARRLASISSVLDCRQNPRDPEGNSAIFNMLALVSFCFDAAIEVAMAEQYWIVQYPLTDVPHETRKLAYLPFAPRVRSFERPFGPHLIDADMRSMLLAYYKSAYRDTPHSEAIRYALSRWYLAEMRVYAEDEFVDLCIALEAIFVTRAESKQGPITHRLAMRLGNYFGNDDSERLDYYNKTKALYDIRATIVHGGIISAEDAPGQLKFAYDLVKSFLAHFLGGDDPVVLLSDLDEDHWIPDECLPSALLQKRKKQNLR